MVSEVLSGGFELRIIIPTHEHEALPQFVGKYIKVKVDKHLVFVALLKQISTVKIKDKVQGDFNIYNQLKLEIEKVLLENAEGQYKIMMAMSDKKESLLHTIDLAYGDKARDND